MLFVSLKICNLLSIFSTLIKYLYSVNLIILNSFKIDYTTAPNLLIIIPKKYIITVDIIKLSSL